MRADSGDFWQCFLMLETVLTFSISTKDFHSKNSAQNIIFGLMSFFEFQVTDQFFPKMCYFAIRKKLGYTIFRRWWVSAPRRRTGSFLLSYQICVRNMSLLQNSTHLKGIPEKSQVCTNATSASSQFNISRIRKLCFQDNALAQDRLDHVSFLFRAIPQRIFSHVINCAALASL